MIFIAMLLILNKFQITERAFGKINNSQIFLFIVYSIIDESLSPFERGDRENYHHLHQENNQYNL